MMIRRKEDRSGRLGKRGFTVLEMIVSIALTGIILGLASPAINELRWEYQLDGFSRQVAMEISRARMQAIAQNRTVRVRPESLARYVVEASDDGVTFTPVTDPIAAPAGMLIFNDSNGMPVFDRQGRAPTMTKIYFYNKAGLKVVETTRLGRVTRF